MGRSKSKCERFVGLCYKMLLVASSDPDPVEIRTLMAAGFVVPSHDMAPR